MSKVRLHQKYDDTIQCFFFSSKNYNNSEWQELCDLINKTITSLSQEYIWHRDEFKVVLPITSGDKNDIPQHLISITCFGDNVEDEWFIVYLLLELTKTYPDLIIQIEDNDGDFLLIEAADFLPTWANPDTTENRVFIHDHSVHIIPPCIIPVDSILTLNEALQVLTLKSEETKASPEIQQAIFKRIGSYPQQIHENCHRTIIKLPVEIASVLTLKPSLISYLVSTYCSLDALDAKLCKDIDFDDGLNVEIKLTKFLYAMLVHTRFPTGYRFKTMANDAKTKLGLKLICAYKKITTKSASDVFSTPEYKTFINSLINNGYFKENLQGSVEYTRLLANAQTYFSNMECPISTYVCNIINDIKSTDKFKSTIELLQNKSDRDLLEEDDDTWLNIHPDQLNVFLNDRYGKKNQMKNNDPITPHIINSDLTKFLKETSDFEGVEKVNTENENETIEFNSEQFVSCLERMLSIISSKDVSDDSDQSDFSDECDNSIEVNNVNVDQDRELASKLKTTDKGSENDEETVLKNFIHSMKEEGLSGPASTVLRTIGINKCDLIDSDDDE
ncbi:protein ecdysoneless homolog [Vanessa atalanta]|uniref:protein ecdysoneless homolog n=1 Tax=Vanessa atalanta TaxID=42275 RepID=UPI001FCD9A75|nr:protein ecdysoneless homolog [Vanessa atalanta]